jgi:hypothetical protein
MILPDNSRRRGRDDDNRLKQRAMERIEALRRRRGINQDVLESTAELPKNWITKHLPPQKPGEVQGLYLYRIARELGVPMEYFFDDEIDDLSAIEGQSDQSLIRGIIRRIGTKKAIDRLLDDRDRGPR